jgi:hypothetical protein
MLDQIEFIEQAEKCQIFEQIQSTISIAKELQAVYASIS